MQLIQEKNFGSFFQLSPVGGAFVEAVGGAFVPFLQTAFPVVESFFGKDFFLARDYVQPINFVWFQILKGPGPYPTVVLPKDGGYWLDGQGDESLLDNCTAPSMHLPNMSNLQNKNKMEVDETAKLYRRHFLGKVRKESQKKCRSRDTGGSRLIRTPLKKLKTCLLQRISMFFLTSFLSPSLFSRDWNWNVLFQVTLLLLSSWSPSSSFRWQKPLPLSMNEIIMTR